MKSFRVTMIDRRGKTIKDTLPAESNEALLHIIKAQGNYLISSEEVKYIAKRRGKLKLDALMVFTYQMSAMLSAGVNLIEALKFVQSKAIRDTDKKIYRNLYEEVQKGNSLSASMMDQGGAFDALLISMVRSGESSGSLGDCLQTMANQYERDKKINQKTKTASIYPITLFVISIIVVLALVTFVLPGIMGAFQTEDVPFLTGMLIGVSEFVIDKWYILGGIVIGLAICIYLMLNTRSTRVVFDQWILNIPKAGKLWKTVYSARCARSFASLYSHGVNALEMIELTRGVLGNTYLEDQFDMLYINVSRGESLSRSINYLSEFDPMLPAMISVGEETGNLEMILNKTADYFDQEAEAALTRLIAMVEPIMIIWMGLMIGIIIISILQPMFQMYGQM